MTDASDRPAPDGSAADLFTRRAILVVGVIILVALVLLFVSYVLQVLLSVFGGVLIAILLRIPTDWLSQRTRLPGQVSLVIVGLLLLGLLVLFGWLVAPSVDEQLAELGRLLPLSLERLLGFLDQSAWASEFLDGAPIPDLPSIETLLVGLSGAFSSVIGFLTSLFIGLLVGFYLAFQPELYVNGIVRLFPKHQRAHAREVIEAIGDALKWWLIGRVFAMFVLGTAVGIGLAILKVPLALILAIVAGLLSFVPVVGSVLSVIPIALVALVQGPSTLLSVLILYYAVQTLETYILTPAVQQVVVSLPPAVAIVVQVMLGVVAGSLGVTMAFPLAVVGMVLVQMLYIEDVLGDKWDPPTLGRRRLRLRLPPQEPQA